MSSEAVRSSSTKASNILLNRASVEGNPYGQSEQVLSANAAEKDIITGTQVTALAAESSPTLLDNLESTSSYSDSSRGA